MDSIIKKFGNYCKNIPNIRGDGNIKEKNEFKITPDVIDECLEEALEKIIIPITNVKLI
jgi:hypothetical protein